MDTETKVDIMKQIMAEIVTEDELRTLFETKEHPVAYDGFEPSGMAHLPLVYKGLIIEKLNEMGIEFNILLADSFAWINNKMGGDLDKIREVAKYFMEVWKPMGIKVNYIWHKEYFDDPEYWKKVILIAKNHTIARAKRALTIAGRLGQDSNPMAFLFYPSMQCADIFHMNVDICQLGIDQRKINMLAREIAGKKELIDVFGYTGGVNRKPVVASHKLLPGLEGPKKGEEYDEDVVLDKMISSKMSKSKPDTCIFVHDSREEIFRKIRKAYCPEKIVEDNPILFYTKEILFLKYDRIKIEREEKFGGDIEYENYEELEKDYAQGSLHPLDLKNAVAHYLDEIIAPIREHFEKGRARELLEEIRKYEITR